MMNFKLEEIRKARKLTRQELSDRSGVHFQTICALELNKTNPSEAKLSTLVSLARVLKCKVKDFYPDEKCI